MHAQVDVDINEEEVTSDVAVEAADTAEKEVHHHEDEATTQHATEESTETTKEDTSKSIDVSSANEDDDDSGKCPHNEFHCIRIIDENSKPLIELFHSTFSRY